MFKTARRHAQATVVDMLLALQAEASIAVALHAECVSSNSTALNVIAFHGDFLHDELGLLLT